jgi:methyltransferase
MTRAVIVFVVVSLPMLLEARRSWRNERVLRRSGAVEPPGDVFATMQVAYPGCFLLMIGESWMWDRGMGRSFVAGVLLFAAAKMLKYWAIATLGPRWSFRVLVTPGAPLVASGPYRWLRHPNYVGVAGELAGAALMAYAPVSGVLSLVLFGALMLARIRVEERALGLS